MWEDCFPTQWPFCLQTGSGKTHTLLGDLHHAEQMGIVPRAVSALAAGLVSRASPSCSLQVPHCSVAGMQLTATLLFLGAGFSETPPEALLESL